MDKVDILERLVSIKNNANERASREARGNPILQQEIKASMLQCGIEQLIIEIQNNIIGEYQSDKSSFPYKVWISSQAS